MADYFISDTHFSHKNLILGTSQWPNTSHCRPFASLAEHDELLLHNINSVVQPDDVLWHLGDWSFGGKANIFTFREAIRCKNVMLIYGNHDQNIRRDIKARELFAWTGDFRTIYHQKQMIVMCHYALQVWEDNHRGAWMLHGHSHNSLDHEKDGRILDVCPDGHDWKPWSFDQIREHMSAKAIVAKDHHDETRL